jgi:hypothetical protein
MLIIPNPSNSKYIKNPKTPGLVFMKLEVCRGRSPLAFTLAGP